MSDWRILYLCELAAIWIIVLQALALPIAILGGILSGSGDSGLLIEIFFIWPAIFYGCAGHVGRFELIAPEGTSGVQRVIAYCAHALGMLGVLYFLLLKIVIHSGASHKWRDVLVVSPQVHLVFALAIAVVAFLVVRNYNKLHPEKTSQ